MNIMQVELRMALAGVVEPSGASTRMLHVINNILD